MSATIASLLPAPPLRLQPEFVSSQRRRAGWAFAGALVAGAYCVGYVFPAVSQLWRDSQLEAGSHVVEPAEWHGLQASRGWLGVDTVGIAFLRRDGRPVSLRLELCTYLPFSTTRPLKVLFARDDRARWTTNWSLEQFGNRIAATTTHTILFGGLFVLALGVAFRAVWSLRRARRVAHSGTVVVGTVEDLRVHPRKNGALRVWRVRIDDANGNWRLRGRFPVGSGQPLHLPAGRVLVLVAAGTRVELVLRQDLWPLKLRDDDVERVGAVLRELAPEAGWRTTATTKGTRLTCAADAGLP